MSETHPNFKSLISTVNDIKSIYANVGLPLMFQKTFKKKSTSEMNWNKNKLKSFRLIPEEIDRLYIIHNPRRREYDNSEDNDDNFIEFRHCIYYYLLVRIDHKGFKDKLYIEMISYCNFLQGWGTIYISSDINLFMKITLTHLYEKSSRDKVYDFIKIHDNYYIEDFDMEEEMLNYKYVQKLEHLCTEAICKNKLPLAQLPKTLRKNLENIIKYQKNKDEHENFINSNWGCSCCDRKLSSSSSSSSSSSPSSSCIIF